MQSFDSEKEQLGEPEWNRKSQRDSPLVWQLAHKVTKGQAALLFQIGANFEVIRLVLSPSSIFIHCLEIIISRRCWSGR